MTAPRIVLDSNVIISAFLFGGHPARIVEHVLDGSLQCFVSLAILDEIRDVLQRPKFGLSSEQALAFIEELHNLCRAVTPTARVRAINADPDDNRVLECALAADADTIVSGDSHLLNLGQWQNIRILAPAEFIREFEGQ
ncbi:MAG: putative toxin-antitoxin system toxin component, PIN family [Kiritimatiellae bacterium]|nr:putative toxin-antitoxin system toxin component, PIN family [Kiritimatiellia bacterium]